MKKFAVHDGRGSTAASGRERDGVCHISLPRDLRFKLIVLHEITHGLGYYGHGREFCSTYLRLVRRFLGRELARNLRIAFTLEGVRHRRRRSPKRRLIDEFSLTSAGQGLYETDIF